VRREVRARGGGTLRAIVNNAGVMGVRGPGSGAWEERRTAAAGAPAAEGAWDASADPHLGPNHLGPFLLTHRLRGVLGAGSRVVNVASRAHFQSPGLEFGPGLEVMGNPRGWYRQYARSKAANVAFTAELRRQWPGVGAVAVSPGRVATGIFDSLPWPVGPLVRLAASVAFQTPREGARGVVAAVTDPALGPGAAAPIYLHLGRPAEPSAESCDPETTARLWAASERYCGIAATQGGGRSLT